MGQVFLGYSDANMPRLGKIREAPEITAEWLMSDDGVPPVLWVKYFADTDDTWCPTSVA